MKRKILILLAVFVAGMAVLTGCEKDKPYSSYNIGAIFMGLPSHADGTTYTKEEAAQLPADQRDLYFVADYLAGWLIENGYVRNSYVNPLIVEGDDLAYNDKVAYDMYRNEVKRLDEVDLGKVIVDAQKLSGASKLELTTSGTVMFTYSLTRTSTLPEGSELSKTYVVPYEPTGAAASSDGE